MVSDPSSAPIPSQQAHAPSPNLAQTSPKTLTTPKRKGPPPRAGNIPIFTRLKARNLYLSQALPYKAISSETGLTVTQLEQLAHREGWTKLRAKAKERLLRESIAREEAISTEVLESIASVSEQHAVKGLEKVGDALERNDEYAAKDFQSYTAGVKNLVGIAKAIRSPGADNQPGSVNLSVFVGNFGPAAEPKAVEQENVTDV